MMCHKMGRPPIGTIGLGRNSVSSRKRVPNPPHKITTFILFRDCTFPCNYSQGQQKIKLILRFDRTVQLFRVKSCRKFVTSTEGIRMNRKRKIGVRLGGDRPALEPKERTQV